MGVPSPCVNVCRMHPGTGWCEGCARTIEEIAAWGSLPDAARQHVWRLLPERRARLQAARVAANAGRDAAAATGTAPGAGTGTIASAPAGDAT